MGDDLNQERKRAAMDRVAKVQEILRRWDPIGVQPGEFAPADEYDSYAPHIVSMVAQGFSREQLCTHLGTVRVDTIGIEANRERDSQIAGEIIETIRGETMDRRPNIPTIIGDGRVLYYTRIDERHVPRQNTAAIPFGLAICDVDGSGIFLFTCEDDWMPVFDSWHGTVEEAKRQAAFQFEGVKSTWEQPPV